MEKTLALTFCGLAMIAGAPVASAQNAAPSEQNSAAISDSDIKAYASVATKLSTIQADASLSEADKNARMASAVQASGIDMNKFNAITAASRTDPQVRQKIQEAMAK